MKILCTLVPNYRYGMSFEELNYLEALRKKGNEVKIFPLIMPEHQYPVPVDSQLLDVVSLYKPDMIISWIYRNTIRKETFEYLSKSINTVGFFGDDEKFFNGHSSTPSKEFTSLFNNSITTYKPAVEWHKKAGAKNIIYMPYCANGKFFKKMKKVQQHIPVSFCGARKDTRIDILNAIALDRVKIQVYGVGWPSGELNPLQYVELINRTKVNINLSVDRVGNEDIVQVKGRDFEVPMSGGFLLTHSGAIDEFYKPGKEIEVYNNLEELIDKIKYYLMKEEKRIKIAEAGHKRALKDHKSSKRIGEMLKKINRGIN